MLPFKSSHAEHGCNVYRSMTPCTANQHLLKLARSLWGRKVELAVFNFIYIFSGLVSALRDKCSGLKWMKQLEYLKKKYTGTLGTA